MINDSSPGIAVDSIRDEMRTLKRSLDSGRHATEGLRNLVVSLRDQVDNYSVVQHLQLY